jgi:hypothetical protein
MFRRINKVAATDASLLVKIGSDLSSAIKKHTRIEDG